MKLKSVDRFHPTLSHFSEKKKLLNPKKLEFKLLEFQKLKDLLVKTGAETPQKQENATL